MDDSSAKMRANMERVLRAMDVIPPLGSGRRQANRVDDDARAGRDEPTPTGSAVSPSSDQPEDRSAIPQFDLGEKILAEQRRLTAAKRRAPGAPEGASDNADDETQTPIKVASDTGPSREQLIQLQQIVAGIVARDIERLCTGPACMTP